MLIDLINYPLVEIPAGPFTMGTFPTGLRKTDPEEPHAVSYWTLIQLVSIRCLTCSMLNL